ncbi:MAG: chromate efflux transporter [Gammaproteobacteria bacterium]|nr:chromate efflux transporter [Gammaproteobacteria bacterium]
MSTITNQQIMSDKVSNWMLFWTFLKIGSTAFGGFMALISVVQNYLVDRKKLLSDADILNGISLATILPGPVAVNVVAYAGYRINGLLGAAICATAVILPSFLLILALSHLYFTWGEIPAVNNAFKGFIPAVAAIIVAATINMAKKTLTGKAAYFIAIIALMFLTLVGGFYSTIGIIVAAGLAGILFFSNPANTDNQKAIAHNTNSSVAFPISLIAFLALPLSAIALPFFNTGTMIAVKLLVTFAGMSVLLFGGGFVFIPMIQEIVVDSYGWVTNKEFIDGVALGQITPGPILISATFIGYKMAGVLGATAATIGIFLPPAILMLVCAHFLDKLKNSKIINAALSGIRCGVIGMIAAAAIVVVQSAEPNWISAAIFSLAILALLKFKIEVAWIIPASGLAGFLLY